MKRLLITSMILCILITLTACTAPPTQPAPAPVSTALPQLNMPNPASVYCEQQGNKLELHTAADGSQSGYCIFPDGSECDERAYFRGECGPSVLPPTIYTDLQKLLHSELNTQPMPGTISLYQELQKSHG